MYKNEQILLEEILEAIRQQTVSMIDCFNAVNQINVKVEMISQKMKETERKGD